VILAACQNAPEQLEYKNLLKNGSAEEQYEFAVKATENRNSKFSDEKVFNLLLSAAQKGLPRAQHEIGKCYEFRRGVSVNRVEAFKWYLKAAEQDFSEAMNEVAFAYEIGWGVPKNIQLAIKWYEKAASIGDVEAQKSLASIYQDYDEGQNLKLAYSYYLLAAEQGDDDAQYQIGKMLYHGIGRERNRLEAVRWLQKSALQHHEDAQFLLGRCFALGEGVEQNYETAYFWLSIASPDYVVYGDDDEDEEWDCSEYLFYQVIGDELSEEQLDTIHDQAFKWSMKR